MNVNTTAIANHLNVEEKDIVRIEEWASVDFVVISGVGGRFVSKKVSVEFIERLEELGNRWQKGGHDRIYIEPQTVAAMLQLSNSKARQINANRFYYDLVSGQFNSTGGICYGVTDVGITGIGYSGSRQPYWVEAVLAAI